MMCVHVDTDCVRVDTHCRDNLIINYYKQKRFDSNFLLNVLSEIINTDLLIKEKIICLNLIIMIIMNVI